MAAVEEEEDMEVEVMAAEDMVVVTAVVTVTGPLDDRRVDSWVYSMDPDVLQHE